MNDGVRTPWTITEKHIYVGTSIREDICSRCGLDRTDAIHKVMLKPETVMDAFKEFNQKVPEELKKALNDLPPIASLPDSGTRTQFGEGMAHREADPMKPAVEGISPFAIFRLGLLFTKGGIKYKNFRNWELGMPTTRYIAAIIRHTFSYLARDESEDHLAAIMWNAQCLIHHEEAGTTSGKTFEDIDDRPRWVRTKKP